MPYLQSLLYLHLCDTIGWFEHNVESCNVSGYPTVAQKQNVELVNILADFQVYNFWWIVIVVIIIVIY